eukprot:4072877-Pleurochrysis_carterae.AAC.4
MSAWVRSCMCGCAPACARDACVSAELMHTASARDADARALDRTLVWPQPIAALCTRKAERRQG